MGIFPVAGLNARQQLLTPPLNSVANHGTGPSFASVVWSIRLRIGNVLFLRCRNHAVTMAHRSGGYHTPWAVFLPYRFNGFPCFFINLIDKSLSYRHSCRAMAGKHHSCFRREKTRKEAALDACSHPFRVFQNSRLFNSHGLFGLKKLCVEQMGIVVPLSTFSIPKNSANFIKKRFVKTGSGMCFTFCKFEDFWTLFLH